jgi:hypothetical protein
MWEPALGGKRWPERSTREPEVQQEKSNRAGARKIWTRLRRQAQGTRLVDRRGTTDLPSCAHLGVTPRTNGQRKTNHRPNGSPTARDRNWNWGRWQQRRTKEKRRRWDLSGPVACALLFGRLGGNKNLPQQKSARTKHEAENPREIPPAAETRQQDLTQNKTCLGQHLLQQNWNGEKSSWQD